MPTAVEFAAMCLIVFAVILCLTGIGVVIGGPILLLVISMWRIHYM